MSVYACSVSYGDCCTVCSAVSDAVVIVCVRSC